MKIEMYHILQKPVEIEHRALAAKEWQELADELLKEKPKATEYEAWEKINKALDDKQDEIRLKYPWKKEIEIESLPELMSLIEHYGTISICKEENRTVFYVADV
jgi:serine phosphatase RsbU (regulator of sigma subunit)